MEVRPVAASDLAEPLKLLELSVCEGEPVPRSFAGFLREEVRRGNIEVISAYQDGTVVGVILLTFRASISAGDLFASVEELYVKPYNRRRGIGQALLDAAEKRASSKGISYIEVQATEEEAVSFYRSSGYEEEAEVRVLSRSVALENVRD